MKSVYLLTVGKLKDKNLEAIEYSYIKRINNPKLKIVEVKSSAENKEAEAKEILKKIDSFSNNPFVITLTEFGKELDSYKFSEWFFNTLVNKDIFFIICGAEGPDKILLEKTDYKLSLSQMTMPHKLARIIFIEQIYRAITIEQNHPYHN